MVTKEHTLELLGPHVSPLNSSIFAAFARYQSECRTVIPSLGPTAKANVLNCLIRTEQRRLFVGVKDVRLIEGGNTSFLLIHDELVLWPKKLNRNLLSSNNETEQSMLLKANSGNFPDFLPGQHMVILGYRVDEFWSSVLDVQLTCPNGNASNLWTYRIDAAANSEQLVFDLRSQEDEDAVKVHVKPSAVAVRRKAAINE